MVLTVLYGTQTGCAERVAMDFCALALRGGAGACRCLPADDLPLESWAAASPLVVITSNANQGEAPDTIRRSWTLLLSPDAPSMEGLRFAVFGVGDSLYRKFNYMAKMLHNRMRQLGGEALVHRGLGDESDAKGIDEVFFPWAAQVCAALGIRESPVGLILPLIRYNAEFVSSIVNPTEESEVARDEAVFQCTVERNTRLTAPEHFQAVHEIALGRKVRYSDESTLPLAYDVGDALGVYSTNSETLIDALLHRMDFDGAALLCVTPNTANGLVAQHCQPFFHKLMTLRHFLRHYVDLEAAVSRPLLAMLAEHTPDTEVRERLLELATPEQLDDYMTYAHREKRNVVEVLDDFRDVRPPLGALLSLTEPMRPRLFSISSAPSLDAECVLLTVARLEWRTPYRRQRSGLCSTQLTAAVPGDRFSCFLWQGSLPPPPSPVPLLCIGTGTGVAPLRSLLWECAAATSDWAKTPILLFFGCRNEHADYMYAAEWSALSRGELRGLEVLPAFSRDGAAKFYVQHRMAQCARRIAKLLEAGAHVYVCGNAKQMPKDVIAVLQDIATQCCCDGDEALGQQYLRTMEKEGRFILDTWSA